MCMDELWNRIRNYEGETFFTATGLPFTYTILGGEKLQPIREGSPRWIVSRATLEKAVSMLHEKKAVFNRAIIAPSYVYAILTDPRIAG